MKVNQTAFYYLSALCIVVFLIQPVYAWEVEVHADRELSHDYVIIGVDTEGSFISCPPAPPDFYCRICIEGAEDNFMKLIHQEVENSDYKWTILVNPHGNIGPPVDLTCTLSWDLSSAPNQYIFQLLDQNNTIVVNDMSKQEYYDVSGLGTFYTYNIIAKSNPITDLQYDINNDGVVNLGDVIFLLKTLTGF